MRPPIKWGLVLGMAVGVENFVFGAAGWHAVYAMAAVFLVIAIAINVATVVTCLRETASERSWAGQLRSGLVLGLVGSLLVFAGSWFVSAVAFPDYFGEMAEGYREAYVSMGMSQEAVDEAVAGIAGASPVRSALEGVVGTMVTSLVAAAIAGIWLRKEDRSSALA